MTASDGFDRTLAAWLEDDALSPAPDGALERVVDATSRRRPQPRWLAGIGSRWVGDARGAGGQLRITWSTAVLLLLLLAALIGGALVVGAQVLDDSPLPTGRLGQLAYELEGDILVADWDGTNAVTVADGSGSSACGGYGGEGAIWSPDGRFLTFRSGWSDRCRGTQFISDPKGNVLTSFPGTGWQMAWSPDSTRVATWIDLSRTIGIFGTDGVRQALLTLPPEIQPVGDDDPRWSPDGAAILVEHWSPPVIWEVPIDGSAPREVPLEDPRSVPGAVWSADRARVAYIDIPESTSLVIASADGTVLRLLPGAERLAGRTYDGDLYADPMWSSSGDRVAFEWSRGDEGEPVQGTGEIRTVDVASGTVTTLFGADEGATLIRFSPAGDRILYSPDDANELWSINADGSGARRLVTGATWGDWQALPPGP